MAAWVGVGGFPTVGVESRGEEEAGRGRQERPGPAAPAAPRKISSLLSKSVQRGLCFKINKLRNLEGGLSSVGGTWVRGGEARVQAAGMAAVTGQGSGDTEHRHREGTWGTDTTRLIGGNTEGTSHGRGLAAASPPSGRAGPAPSCWHVSVHSLVHSRWNVLEVNE